MKCALATILQPPYKNSIMQIVADRSIMSTWICALGSLLFLYKVQRAYDDRDRPFFNQDGFAAINECFYGVLVQNVDNDKMVPEFRAFVENLHEQYRFEWPNNVNFGNATGELIKTYATNVTTNLKTHAEKRLVQYLKLKVFQHNTHRNCMLFKYLPSDIDNTVKFLIDKKDIEINSNDDEVKRLRRDCLVEFVRRISWWDIDQHKLFEFEDEKVFAQNWFKSIPMWIAMQREIDEFNLSRAAAYEEEQRQQQAQQPPKSPHQPHGSKKKWQKKLKKKKRGWDNPKKKPWKPRQKQMLDNINDPPEIRNLVVIPICSFKRTHYPMDNFTLYKLLSQYRLLPRNGKRNGMIKFGQFMASKNEMWNHYFKVWKMRLFVRRKKAFDFHILSDGIAVSIQFKSRKSEPIPIDLNIVRTNYVNRVFTKALGIDPGYNKWNTTVQRDLNTGKEVRYFFIAYIKTLSYSIVEIQ